MARRLDLLSVGWQPDHPPGTPAPRTRPAEHQGTLGRLHGCDQGPSPPDLRHRDRPPLDHLRLAGNARDETGAEHRMGRGKTDDQERPRGTGDARARLSWAMEVSAPLTCRPPRQFATGRSVAEQHGSSYNFASS